MESVNGNRRLPQCPCSAPRARSADTSIGYAARNGAAFSGILPDLLYHSPNEIKIVERKRTLMLSSTTDMGAPKRKKKSHVTSPRNLE